MFYMIISLRPIFKYFEFIFVDGLFIQYLKFNISFDDLDNNIINIFWFLVMSYMIISLRPILRTLHLFSLMAHLFNI